MKRRDFLQHVSAMALPLVLPWQASAGLRDTEARLTIGLVADAHQDIMHDAEARLAAFIAATQARNSDLNIQLGDFCFPLPENKAFLSIWNEYTGPKYHVLGNHDMDTATKAETMAFWGMEAPYYSFDVNGYHLVVLDANFLRIEGSYRDYAKGNFYVDNAYRAWVHPEQIEWLAEDLRQTDLPTLVFSHQGLAHELWGVKNRRIIQRSLEQANREAGFQKVIACLNGHNHVDDCRLINGIYYLEINSLSYQWLGENYACRTRYPEELYARKPVLEKVAPFADPLFAILSLSPGQLRLEGVQSQWIGPSPTELGLPKGFYSIPYTPEITDRELALGE